MPGIFGPPHGRRAQRTQVGIVGAGPAGLVLSRLLARAGIESVVVDQRSRAEIESTVRAGILEQGTVELLSAIGAGERALREGFRHEGIGLRWGGETHRIDFADLVGRAVWLYPQHEVLRDLIGRSTDQGADLRFDASEVAVHDVATDRPSITFTDADGTAVQPHCDVIAGCDGTQGVCRWAIPDAQRTDHFRAYPFGWFGILTEAPPSADELVYAASERGFALISSRTPILQRMYFQCDPAETPDGWSDARIFDELQSRVAGNGFALVEGPVVERTVIPMRSYVCEPMRYGRLVLAGDAAHSVPPTGAKGLNLAVADVVVLARALEAWFGTGSEAALDSYGPTALRRVWRVQHFSYAMTTMLHNAPGADAFDVRRRHGELESLVSSRAGRTHLAEAYTGWPLAESAEEAAA